MGYRTAFAVRASRHVIQNVFHRFTVRQCALPYFTVRLALPSLTLVRVQ